MKLFKKLFAIVLCLALVLGAVPMMVSADDVPTMSKPEGAYVFYEGLKFSGQLGSASISGSYLPGDSETYCNTHNKEQVNLNNYDYIEFDYYVENISNFKARVSAINVEVYRDGNPTFVIPFTDLVTKDGWNHIKLTIPKGVKDSILKRCIQLKFTLTMSASEVGATDTYKLANIAATLKVDEYNIIPAIVESEGILKMHEGSTRSGTYANFTDPLGGNYTNNSVIDFSKYSYIEFDFYADNANDLKALLSEFTFNFWQSDSRQLGLDFLDQITQDGWNHVKLAISKNSGVALNNIKYYRFRPTKIADANVDTSSRYKIANVCATLAPIDIVPAIVENQITIHEGKKFSNKYGTPTKTGINKYPAAGDQNISVSSDKKDFTVGDHVEFDYFVEDVVTLKEKLTGIHINLIASGNNNGSWVNFIDQITANGWNHIKIKMDDLKYYNSGNSKLTMSNVQYVRFQVAFAESALNVEFADLYAIANVCVTVDAINLVPEIVENQITIHEGKKFSNKYGTPTATGVIRYPAAGDQNITVSSDKKDFTVGDYVEFDYFVDDVVALKEKLTGVHINIIASGNQNGSWVNFIDQITKNGWNHIKIEMDDLKYYGNGGNLTMSNVQYVRFKVAFAESALNVEFADRYAIANVCVTCVHSYNAVVTAPTCTADGYTTYTCKCGDSYVGNTVAATGHKYDEVVTAPTCQAEGYTTYTCGNCGDTYKDNTTAVVDHNYVDGYCSFGCGTKEPAIVYTFGHTLQLTTQEPWQLLFNAKVNDDDNFDYNTLSDYGMYIVAAEGLEAAPTAEELAVIGKAYTKADGIYNEKDNCITVLYEEILATYEMDKEFYVVFYAADKNGNISYGEVKTRSYAEALSKYTAENGYTSEVINFAEKAQAMFEATTEYRNKFSGRHEFVEATPDAIGAYNFENIAIEGNNYKFAHTMQVSTIEPWALIFNASIKLDGEVIDYTSVNDYGVIILSDVEKAPTLNELLANENALVYNKDDMYTDEKKDGYICLDYTNKIQSSEMDTVHYAVFYVEIDGVYYFGEVRERSMMSVAEQYLSIEQDYEGKADLEALLNAMKDLYTATEEYVAWANKN